MIRKLARIELPCTPQGIVRTGAGLAQMDLEIVQDDDIASGERRRQLHLDVGVEGGAIHGAVNP